MNVTIKPVILSGGSGTRLWPLSRQRYPKQLLSIVGKKTLLQNTISRLENLPNISDSVTIVCNEAHRFLVSEQLREISVKVDALLLEPVERNTAPALTLAAIANREAGHDDVLLVLPADHVIKNTKIFQKTLTKASNLAAQDIFVMFGVTPTKPETGYGYIKQGKIINNDSFDIEQFVEKPNVVTAQKYLDSGQFLWNSGMFMMKSSVWLDQIGQHAPAILTACEKAYSEGKEELDFCRIEHEAFAACPSDSIDYAVAEKMVSGLKEKSAVVKLDVGWTDVGAWDEIWNIGAKDKSGNVSKGDVVSIKCENSLFHSEERLIAGIGLKNTIVVETPDAILVTHIEHAQDIRQMVELIKFKGRNESLKHSRVQRPWGYFDSVGKGGDYQIKRITLNPGGVIALQSHKHRAEHWFVISGSAKVTIGHETSLVSENESTYIPVGIKHRLENTNSTSLEMIEIQLGTYFGEDDIERYENIY